MTRVGSLFQIAMAAKSLPINHSSKQAIEQAGDVVEKEAKQMLDSNESATVQSQQRIETPSLGEG